MRGDEFIDVAGDPAVAVIRPGIGDEEVVLIRVALVRVTLVRVAFDKAPPKVKSGKANAPDSVAFVLAGTANVAAISHFDSR